MVENREENNLENIQISQFSLTFFHFTSAGILPLISPIFTVKKGTNELCPGPTYGEERAEDTVEAGLDGAYSVPPKYLYKKSAIISINSSL